MDYNINFLTTTLDVFLHPQPHRHFVGKKTEAQKVKYLAEVTQLISHRSETRPQNLYATQQVAAGHRATGVRD